MKKAGVLQQNLSYMYHFEPAHKVCDQFNRLINMLRKERKEWKVQKGTHG